MGFWDLVGGAARGATSASLWTGNMIYTALQNAKSKREIKDLYEKAADANFKNRSVAVLPDVSKQDLLLINGKDDDNDVYDYQTQSSTAALDYIWREDGIIDSLIVSGGDNKERVCSLITFVHKAQEEEIPVLVLHNGNRELENMITKHSICHEFISNKGFYYDVFRGLPVDDMAYLLYETMPKDVASPAAESLLRALLEVLLITDGKITINNLSSYKLISLKTDIDTMKNNGSLNIDDYNEINQYYMAGSSSSDAVRIFLNRLNRQAEAVFGKVHSRRSNMKSILNQKGVIAIDVGSSGNELLLSLVINHLLLLQSQGREFALVFDDIPIAKHEKICDLIRSHHFAICSQDFVSSLSGGTRQSEDLFSEITGNINMLVLFRHASGPTCQKWSDYLGKYHKIRIRYNISQSNAYMNSSETRGLYVDETEEPRIRPDTLSRLGNGIACIHSIDGILIAQVKE